jgi:hypothetical protein
VDNDTQACHATNEVDCHSADVSTVFYFGGDGGATIVFNQTFNSYGLSPRIPNEAALCSPSANRLLVFDGNLYHGVLKESGDAQRLTLLVNFWRRKPEQAVKNKPSSAALAAHTHVGPSVSHRRLPVARALVGLPFDAFFENWVQHELPGPVRLALKDAGALGGLSCVQFKSSNVNVQIPATERIPSWYLGG